MPLEEGFFFVLYGGGIWRLFILSLWCFDLNFPACMNLTAAMKPG